MKTEIRARSGIPWLYVDGRPFDHDIYCRAPECLPGHELRRWEDYWRDIRAQARAGCRIILPVTNCAADFYERPWGDVWTASGDFDYGHVDRMMRAVHATGPDLLVMPKIMLTLPCWWEERHPEEIQRFHDGRTQANFTTGLKATRDQVVSLASERGTADLTDCLERFVDYMETHYGDRMAGYLVCGGITHEWGLLGSFDFIDYSDPMRRTWRRWVRHRYGNNAPYDPNAIPTPEERLLAEGSFRNPAQSQAAIDFQRCISDLTVERIVGYCETIKRRTGGRKVVATYYGYTLTCREGGLDRHGQFVGRYGCGGFQGGHLSMRKLLASPAVDLVTSPFSYQNRRLGEGDVQPHYAETSVRRAGKISLLQDDNRSWRGHPVEGIDCGYEAEPNRFLQQLRRSFARRLCGDDLMYRADVLGGNYDDPRILAELRRLQQCFEHHAPARAASEADMLVVVDEDAIPYLSLASGLQYQNVYLQSSQWARTGAAYHVMLVEDAAEADVSAYPLVLMTNAIRARPAVVRLVDRARMADSSLVFFPGSGLVGPRGPDPEAAMALTGLRLELLSRDEQCVRACYRMESGAQGVYGNERALSHLLIARDPEAETWSTLEESGLPSLAVKPRAAAGRCFDAYATIAPLPWDLLARLADRAGCHRYARRGERIWKSPGFVGVHSSGSGDEVCLRLRDDQQVREAVLPPRAWAQVGSRLTLKLDTLETAVFALEGNAELPQTDRNKTKRTGKD